MTERSTGGSVGRSPAPPPGRWDACHPCLPHRPAPPTLVVSCRGLISSVGLMPITFILPPIMWIRARQPQDAELALCWTIAVSCAVVAALSFVGSARNIVVLAGGFGVF